MVTDELSSQYVSVDFSSDKKISVVEIKTSVSLPFMGLHVHGEESA